jgi:hypothetical protein
LVVTWAHIVNTCGQHSVLTCTCHRACR